MNFGIDEVSCIDCLFVTKFKGPSDTKRLFIEFKTPLYIQTKPKEYAERIPLSVTKSLEMFNVDTIRLTSSNKLISSRRMYRFIPNIYDN